MFHRLTEMLGIKPGVNLHALMKNGAQIVDVRSKAEFASGHIAGSINIPLQELSQSTGKIAKSKPVIVCCASGVRSASAKSILKGKGFDVHNGGGWRSLQNKKT